MNFGNLKSDPYKKITNITYNHLNLPVKITFVGGETIAYTYLSDGRKIKKIVQDSQSNTTATAYREGFQYKDQSLEFFPHAEGYVKATQTMNGSVYNYVYTHTDHLGNIRIKYTKHPQTGDLKILEENHYYPGACPERSRRGLTHSGYNGAHLVVGLEQPGTDITLIEVTPDVTDPHRYKFGGKEWQDEFDVNVYDFGARNYDPALGRWMNLDPLAEKYSQITPYAYAANSPIYFIDPDGMKIINGDEVRRKEAEDQYNTDKETLQSKADYLGISVNSSRKEWKNAAIAKGGKIEWALTKNVRNWVKNSSKDLNNYTSASKNTEARINELKTGAGELFDKIDALDTHVYIQTVDNLRNNDGQNNNDFDVNESGNVSLKSVFDDSNSTHILLVNKPSNDRTTLEVSQHELGHFDYIVENTTSYYNWLKENNLLNSKHDGHKKGDPSGKRATQFQNKNFKKKK